MTVWIEQCFQKAAEPNNSFHVARCYEYIGLAVIGLIIVCVCVVLLFKDMRRKGGLSLAFLKQHQTVILGLCTIFSLGKPRS